MSPPPTAQAAVGHRPASVPPVAGAGFVTASQVAADGCATGESAAAARVEVVPVLTLTTQKLLVESTSRHGTEYREREVAVLRLAFDYGSTRIRLSDEREGFFVGELCGLVHRLRDRSAETQAQCVLESFGAVELSCLEEMGVASEADADYLVSVSDSVHALCSFGAYAVPQLRKLGWLVNIDRDYPYQVVSGNSPWYAHVGPAEPDEEGEDWFSLELGVDVDGQRCDLLESLLELLKGGTESDSLASLFQTPARFRAVQVGTNRYVALAPERLRMLLVALQELHGEGNDARFSRCQAVQLAAVEEVFEEEDCELQLKWTGETEVLVRGRSLLAGPEAVSDEQVDGLLATLRPYQQDGLEWLQHLVRNEVGGVLADDMGLGKTLQTIAHIWAEYVSGRMDLPALVVVPTSLIGNWQREISKFAPRLEVLAIRGAKRALLYEQLPKANVVITTYPVLVRDLEKFQEQGFHLLVLDEAQTIKNSRSLSNAAVNALEARHKLCLTGTPVENNLAELWSLFDFLMPGFLGVRAQFKTRYQTPIEKDHNEGRLGQLRSRVAPFILRRMKDTVAKDLPPKTELVRPVDIEAEQRDLYESIRLAAHSQVRRVIRKQGLAGSTVPILDALMKLRQVCCDPRLVSSAAAAGVQQSAKYQFLMELLVAQLGQGRRILIFSQFTQMLSLIGEGLSGLNVPYIELTGATQDRQGKCDEFEGGKADVFLISLKAGGTGLNLTSADTVIHYDPWWNPAAQAQATDRAYRIGQKRPVFVYNLIIAGSVEERMLRLQRQKQHLADTILGTGGGGPLTESDIEDLFQPLD